MNTLEKITITIRAEIRRGASRPEQIGREVTANVDEPIDDIRATVTLALRQVNDELKGLVR